MILKKLYYKEYEGTFQFWELQEFQLNNINLIVGNNASGKSRTLNVIYGLARMLLSPKILYNCGAYTAVFEKGDSEITYEIEFNQGIIILEKMVLDQRLLFSRNADGLGEILNSEIKQMVKFKVPKNEMLVYRRDEIQFPYLEDLFFWASNTRYFRFSKEQEKLTLSIVDSNKAPLESFNFTDGNQAIEVFRLANEKYGAKYVALLIADFNKIGYSVSSIDLGQLHSIKVSNPIGDRIYGLRVKENDRTGNTDQNEMSDGMFRVLSILIHYNYYVLEEKALNILIDDIGEGLDFERSGELIKILIEKSKHNQIQLIMSTNDKFVMNHTSLDYWQLISRVGGVVKMRNKHNSAKEFEEFRFVGLNNFDFFSTDFYKTGFSDEHD